MNAENLVRITPRPMPNPAPVVPNLEKMIQPGKIFSPIGRFAGSMFGSLKGLTKASVSAIGSALVAVKTAAVSAVVKAPDIIAAHPVAVGVAVAVTGLGIATYYGYKYVRGLNAKISQLEAENTDLNAKVAKQEASIENLNEYAYDQGERDVAHMGELQSQVESKAQALESKDARIADLSEQLATKEQELEAARADAEASRQEVEKTKADCNARIDAADESIRETFALQGQILVSQSEAMARQASLLMRRNIEISGAKKSLTYQSPTQE
ncbi:MAG: hypothetical protein LBJ94_01225 [Puniceicoccales bacterium]|jgi:hypothetical protein|nr:hypothetical protein [Puniceicoccales bacterium]